MRTRPSASKVAVCSVRPDCIGPVFVKLRLAGSKQLGSWCCREPGRVTAESSSACDQDFTTFQQRCRVEFARNARRSGCRKFSLRGVKGFSERNRHKQVVDIQLPAVDYQNSAISQQSRGVSSTGLMHRSRRNECGRAGRRSSICISAPDNRRGVASGVGRSTAASVPRSCFLIRWCQRFRHRRRLSSVRQDKSRRQDKSLS